MHALLVLLAVAFPDPPAKPAEPVEWTEYRRYEGEWNQREFQAKDNAIALEKLKAERIEDRKKRYPPGTKAKITGAVRDVTEGPPPGAKPDDKTKVVYVFLVIRSPKDNSILFNCRAIVSDRDWAGTLKTGQEVTVVGTLPTIPPDESILLRDCRPVKK